MKFDYIRLVLKDLNNRKFSSFLTFFAISLGILTIFVIFLLGQGFEDSIEKQFEELGSNRLYVSSSSQNFGATATKGLTDSEVELAKSRPYVDEVYPYYMRSSQIKYGNDFSRASVLGTTLSSEFFESMNLEIAEGRFPRSNEKYSVVIGPEASKNTFDREVPVGANLYIRDTKFKVVGILESIGNPEDDKMMVFNIDTLRDLYDDSDSIGYMDVVIVEGYDMEIAEENLKITLENKLGEDSVNVVAPTQLLEQASSILDIIKYTLGGIAFVALIVGAIGIINTMFVIITEKTREIGIMKSIGATNEDILFMYVFQAGTFGFLGAVLGVILGSFAAVVFEFVAQQSGFSFLEITIKINYIVYLLIFGIVIGVISGYIPARKASKINIIEAIRK